MGFTSVQWRTQGGGGFSPPPIGRVTEYILYYKRQITNHDNSKNGIEYNVLSLVTTT